MNVDHTRYSPFVFRVRSIDHDTRKNFLWVSVVQLLILCPCIYLQDYLKAIRVIKLTQLYLRVLFTPCAVFLVRISVAIIQKDSRIMSWTGLWLWQCYLNSGIFSGIDSGTFSETYKCNIDINDRIIQERLLYNFFPKISTSEVFFFFFTIKQRIYRKKDKDRILKQNNSTEIFFYTEGSGTISDRNSRLRIRCCKFPPHGIFFRVYLAETNPGLHNSTLSLVLLQLSAKTKTKMSKRGLYGRCYHHQNTKFAQHLIV